MVREHAHQAGNRRDTKGIEVPSGRAAREEPRAHHEIEEESHRQPNERPDHEPPDPTGSELTIAREQSERADRVDVPAQGAYGHDDQDLREFNGARFDADQ